ncbi:extracellular solute-binding protein [Cohnella endophytica]|uniref:Extracellular solute-binding protein n=1 Tax=Cohnella endophytica TaxID=2419778 RepID=A0A494XXK7_9BACL|nr:extracellular solute-binding protein [Cohnella endophytica]RKP55305.1 extracellular solute-binding protein [Cohnella endophytica]
MIKTSKRARKWVLTGLTLSLLIPTLAACSTSKGKDADVKRTLRIGTMYGTKQDDSWFRQQFTDIFEITHDSNIEIEIVPAIDYSEQQFEDQSKQQEQPDPLEKVKAIMTGTNPVDVMIFDLGMLGQLVNENLLKQLDPLLKEDKIDVNDFVPTVIEGIKDQGNNFIYGLTPTFTPAALFYNKTLFTKQGVEFPKDGMSWDDVFNLAKRMKSGSGKDSVFGFTFNQWGAGDNFWDVQNFAAPLQLKMFDAKGETMTVNTPQWEAVWKSVTDLYKDHVTPHQEDMQAMYEEPAKDSIRNPFQGQLFLNNKVAMTIGNYDMINQIQQLNDNADKLKINKLDWDVVTVPFHPGHEGIGGNIYLNNLAGINANAANPDDAWEFVKFMNGKEWAKLKSRSTYEMSARKEFVKVREGMSYNLNAFMTMKPAPLLQSSAAEQKLYREKPNLDKVTELGSRAYSDVIQGKKSVKEALAQWETKGNDLLQKIKANPKGPIDGIFDDVYGGGGGISIDKQAVMEAAGEG